MRRYKLSLTPTASLEFNTLWFEELRAGNLRIIQKLFTRLALLAMAALPILLAINFIRVSKLEAEQLYLLLVVSAFVIVCALVTAVLVGMRYFADPPLFMYVLIFSLTVIGTYLTSLIVVVEPGAAATFSQANTFGNPTQKLLSGVFIMGAVALFYGMNTFINTNRKLKLILHAWLTGIAVGALVLLFDPAGGFFLESTVFMGLISLFLAALFAGRRYVGLVLMLVTFTAAVNLVRQGVSWEYFFALIISLVVWLYLYGFAHDWNILPQVRSFVPSAREVFEGKQRVGKFVANHIFPIGALALIILIFMVSIWVMQHRINIAADLNNWVAQTRSVQNALNKTWQAAFVGVGANSNAMLSSTLLSVLQYNGIFGLLAYILVMVTTLGLVTKGLLRELRSNAKFKLMNILFPFVLGVPLLSVFMNLPINTAIFWWMAMSIATASTIISNRRLATFSNMELKIRGREVGQYMPVVQIVVIILLIVVWVLLSQSIWQLVMRGTL